MPANMEYLWWQTGVIYQIYPRSFRDTTGNGIGDLAGIEEKLDYLALILGVDAIWLSPFYPSPMADFGYDVADYTGVDPLFGDLDALDSLVANAHRSGLKVIIDLVPNHTSDQHPWFLESRLSRVNLKRDWYVWADPKADGQPPNNWLSVFGGPAWAWDERTGQFYLHSFLKEQPDLNWRNPAVKEAMFSVARFWLARGIDGFRIDVAHFIMKDPDLRDNPAKVTRSKVLHKPLGEYDSQVHLYDQNHPDGHEVYHQFRQLLDSYSTGQPRVAIGEIHIFDLSEWAKYYGEHLDELHLPFNFTLLGARWGGHSVRELVDGLEAALPAGAWPNYVLGNHDEPRLATRYGLAKARVAAMLLLTLRGTPTLYYGDEIGMTDVPVAPEQQQDPWGKRVPGLSRDPCRSAMQWDPGPNAGFSAPETPDLWLPLPSNYREVNIARQLSEPGSLLNLYRQLLAYRRTNPVLQFGGYTPIDVPGEDCFVFLRAVAGREKVLIALNFSGDDQQLSLPSFGSGKVALSTHLDRTETIHLAHLDLRGDEGMIVELESTQTNTG